MEYASATNLLGQVQRGLGRGYLGALNEDPSDFHPLLLQCITQDPRWDKQLDHRRGYYASLAFRIALPLTPLREHLERNDDRMESSWNVPLTISVLGDLARRGSEEAAAILAAYVRVGFWWWDALDELMAAEATEWLPKLEPVVAERSAAEPQQATESSGDWSEGRRQIAEVDRIAANLLIPDGPERDTAAMTTAEILAAAEAPGPLGSLAEELADRDDNRDVELLLVTAGRRDALLWSRWLSLQALAMQGDPRLVGILEANLHDQETPRTVRVASSRAFGLLPAALTLDLARRWFDGPTDWQRRAAERVLSKHATLDDLPRLLDAVAPALADDNQYRVCSIAEALERLPEDGPYPQLTACFEEMTYSFGRRYVAASLAATDPRFTLSLAVECLWDCEYATRSLGCRAIELSDTTRARLEEMVEDPLEEEEVIEAALQRLGRASDA